MVEIVNFYGDVVTIVPVTVLCVPELKLKEAPSQAFSAPGLVRYGRWRSMH